MTNLSAHIHITKFLAKRLVNAVTGEVEPTQKHMSD
jgi:hypothetical protein